MSVRGPMLLLLLSAMLLMETSAWDDEFIKHALEALGEGKRHAGDYGDASTDVARSSESNHGSSPLQQLCQELQATRTIFDQNTFQQSDENKDGKLDEKELDKIIHDCIQLGKNGV